MFVDRQLYDIAHEKRTPLTIARTTLDGPTFVDPKANARNLTNALIAIEKIANVQVLSNPPLSEEQRA